MRAGNFPLIQRIIEGIWQPSVAQSHRLSGLFPSHHIHSVSCRSYNHITLLTKAPESHDQSLAIISLMMNREWDGRLRNESETTNTENKRWGGWEGRQWEWFIIQDVTPLVTCVRMEKETHSKLDLPLFYKDCFSFLNKLVTPHQKRNDTCFLHFRPNIGCAIVSSSKSSLLANPASHSD